MVSPALMLFELIFFHGPMQEYQNRCYLNSVLKLYIKIKKCVVLWYNHTFHHGFLQRTAGIVHQNDNNRHIYLEKFLTFKTQASGMDPYDYLKHAPVKHQGILRFS